MPIVNVKSPEIAKLDQEAEVQRQHNEWLRYQLTEEPACVQEDWKDIAGFLGGIVLCILFVRVIFYIALGW